MQVSIQNQDLCKIECDILIVNLFEGITNPQGATGAVDQALEGAISNFVIKEDNFEGKFGQNYILPTYGKIPAKKVIIAGLGKAQEFNLERLMEVNSKLIQCINKMNNNRKVASILHGAGVAGLDAFECARSLTLGAIIGAYSFDKYKSEKQNSKIEDFIICENNWDKFNLAEEGVNKGKITGYAMNYARDLINEPAQKVTPEYLAQKAKETEGVTTKIMERNELEKEGFGAFLAVAQGSVHPPKFIHMTYKGENVKKKIAIIGKGITFDSGGLDLKPAPSMLNMKDDMSGSAVVLAAMKALVKLKPEVEVHGIIAACENMPSGTSYKPGDVLIAKNGKSIEVDNTDAEGRLTLADALCYAEELGVDEIIDIATLTGACMVALGSVASAIMGNNDNLMCKLIEAGEKDGEKLWELPMYKEYNDSLKSDIADMKNTGSRYGGAQIAGIFLKNFVKDTPWAHIDIAGPAYLDKGIGAFAKGPSGAGVRTLLNYICQ